MSFFESDYTPTDADLLDWIYVLQLNEAEETNCDHTSTITTMAGATSKTTAKGLLANVNA